MNTQEIIKMCEMVARRYKSSQHQEDMVQEGIVVCLELLSEDPETPGYKLYRAVNKRIYDYLNLDTHGLSVPASDTVRTISRGEDPSSRTSYSEEGLRLIETVLGADWSAYEEDTLSSDGLTPEEIYERKEYTAYILSVAITSLTTKEWEVIQMRYYRDMTQDEVGEALNCSKMWVSIVERQSLEKLKKRICNNL